MKLCVRVLLLALGVSGHECHESNECDMGDINSHLATKTTKWFWNKKATKATEVAKATDETPGQGLPQINELITQGGTPAIELRGPVDASAPGCLWSLLTDPSLPLGDRLKVDSVKSVSGKFNDNGLLVVSPGLDFGSRDSFAVFLTAGCPDSGLSLLEDDVQFFKQIQQIYNSICMTLLYTSYEAPYDTSELEWHPLLLERPFHVPSWDSLARDPSWFSGMDVQETCTKFVLLAVDRSLMLLATRSRSANPICSWTQQKELLVAPIQ